MTNLILFCGCISALVAVTNASFLLISNTTGKHKDNVLHIDHDYHSNAIEINSNKSKRHIDTSNCTFGYGSSKHESKVHKNDNCPYQQRSKTAAVLISIYFGIFGVDWFYLSRGNSAYIVIGICKLLISCGCCSGWPVLTLGARQLSSTTIKIGYILSTLFTLLSLLWWVIDWTRILANRFLDGNGLELKHYSEYF